MNALQQVQNQAEVYLPEDFGKQEYDNQTTLHPVGLMAVIVLGTSMLLARRKYALLPMLLMACFIAPAQRVVIAGLDFNMIRLLVLFGMTRVLARGEHRGLRLNALDTVIIVWTVASSLAYILQIGTFGAVVNRLGGAYDGLGMYFLFRCLLRDIEDVDQCLAYFGLIAFPVLLAFLVEWKTQRNPFAFLGGVPEFTTVRDGKLRCQGPFPHPILAGCFWAAVLPMVASRWWRPRVNRFFLVLSCLAIVGIVLLSNSSTPYLGVALGGVAWACYVLRDFMRPVRWMALGGLVLLHSVMEAPVWHLLSRVSVASGSTGYHRYRLIDKAIANFGEWWLYGTRSTAHWGPQMFDITNQYVREGAKGGLLALVLFVAVMSLGYGAAGRWRKSVARLRYAPRVAWGMGSSIFVHMGMFLAISISHSQQNLMVWLFVLAAVSSFAPAKSAHRAKVTARRVALPRAAAMAAGPH